MLVLCWQHIWHLPLVPVTGTTPLFAFLAGKYETKRSMTPTNHIAQLTSPGLLLAEPCQNRLCGPLPPQLLQLRSSCSSGCRQPPPSSAFVQVAAGIATSHHLLPAFYFVNITPAHVRSTSLQASRNVPAVLM